MAASCTRSSGRWPRDRCRSQVLFPSPAFSYRGLLLTLAFLSLLPGGTGGHLAGQTVQGQLLDRDTGTPVEGALVLLLDEEGTRVHGYLSNAAGRFLLRAPGPGRFTVRTERIGFETVSSEPMDLALHQTFALNLYAGQVPIELAEIRVEGAQRCVVRPQEGLEVARVWEEARKALTVQQWTEREALYRFHVISYERELDAWARLVESETRRATSGIASNPIRSLPPEELMEGGFVRRLDDGRWEYFGPDAQALLSDPFLNSHCFRLAQDPAMPGLVGLAFEPVRRRGVPGIAGTLWLDRETAHLRHLEYHYTWAPWPEAEGVARGRVEFERLPEGTWIVRRWWIRMPRMIRDLGMAREGRSGIRVEGIQEAGAEVTRITSLSRQTLVRSPEGALTGVVWDSTRFGPLDGAHVSLSGTSYSVTTDSTGHFLMEGLPGGIFKASFLHPRLDTLGIQAPAVEVQVFAGELFRTYLSVPSEASILASACSPEERPPGSSALAGAVRAVGTSEPIPQARVEARWSDFDLRQVGVGRDRRSGLAMEERRHILEALTDADGRYRLCGIPANHLLVVQASFLDRQGDTVHVRVEEDTYNVLDLVIFLPPGS